MTLPFHDASAVRNVERTLSTLIDQHGPTLLHEEARLQQQLDRQCSDAPRANGHLMAALRRRIPLAMLAAESDAHLQAALPGLVDRLTSGTGIDPADARWAVRTWARALALPSTGLDDGPAAPHVARVDAADASRRSSAAHVLGSRSSGDGTVPVASPRRTPAAVASPPPVAVVGRAAAVPVDAGRGASDDRPGDAAPAPVAASAPFATQAQESPRPEPAVPAVPMPDVAAAPAVASRRPAEARTEDAAADVPIAMPAWSLESPTPSRRRWGTIGTAVAAIVVVVVATRRTEAPISPTPSPSAARAPVADRPANPGDVAVPPVAVALESRTPTVSDRPTPAASESPASADVEAPPSSSPPSRDPAVDPSGPPPSASAAAAAAPPAVVGPTAERPVVAKPAPPVAASATPGPASVVASAAPSGRPRDTRAVGAVEPVPTAAPAALAACGRASCGSVVAARAVEDDSSPDAAVRPLRFEMTVRMDDRSIGTVVDSARWPNGTRVRKAGARIERLSAR